MPPPPRLDPLIHQQARLLILSAVYRNRRVSFTDLRDGFALTAGNLASHAARLEEAGYIRIERRLTSAGFELQYVITEKGSEAFTDYLAALQRILREVAAPLPGLADKQTAATTDAES